jgi:hypothetical protein
MSADDTAKQAQDFATTNPNAAPWTNVQACIASSVCERAKPGGPDFQDNTWAQTIVPRFVDRFVDGVDDPQSPWQGVLDECANLLFPFFKEDRCAFLMAEHHIKKDLADALLSMEELRTDGLVQTACGKKSDWDLVFEDIQTCISNEPGLTLDDFFGTGGIEDLRNQVRGNCQTVVGESDD